MTLFQIGAPRPPNRLTLTVSQEKIRKKKKRKIITKNVGIYVQRRSACIFSCATRTIAGIGLLGLEGNTRASTLHVMGSIPLARPFCCDFSFDLRLGLGG